MVRERRAGVVPTSWLLVSFLALLPACVQKPEQHFDTVERVIASYQPPDTDKGFTPVPEELLDYELPKKKPYRLGEGDTVVVQILHTSPIPGFQEGVPAAVKEDGSIRLPILGTIEAIDKTVSELEAALTGPVRESFVKDAVVSVTVTGFGSRRYFVVGEVGSPGTMAANGRTTLMEALLEVGGTNKDTADLDEAYIIRDGEPIPFSVRDLVMSGHPAGRIVMEEHDIVFVPNVRDRADFVYLFGEVGSPTRVAMEHEGRRGEVGTLTLAAAIASVGGLNPRADINEITIYRGGWKAPKRWRVGIQDVYQFGGEIQLQPGDRIAVGTSKAARFSDAFQPFLQTVSATASLLSLAFSVVALTD